MLPDPVRIS